MQQFGMVWCGLLGNYVISHFKSDFDAVKRDINMVDPITVKVKCCLL